MITANAIQIQGWHTWNPSGPPPRMFAFPAATLRVSQPMIFRVGGSAEQLIEVMAWVAGNTTDYQIDPPATSMRAGMADHMHVQFENDVDAVNFKMRWFNE
jgi:hypothetical protein